FAEATMRVVESSKKRARGSFEEIRARGDRSLVGLLTPRAIGFATTDFGNRSRELDGLLVDLAPTLAIGVGEREKDLREARHAVAIRRREVRATEERLLI